jgi:hypothetical protein
MLMARPDLDHARTASKIWEKYAVKASAFIPGTSSYRVRAGKQVVYMTPG